MAEGSANPVSPPSPMSAPGATRLHPMWVVVIAVLCVLGGFGGGYATRALVGGPKSSSSSAGAPAGSPVLSITAAGTLDTAFPDLGRSLVNETTGVQDPSSAQEYQGSLAALGLISDEHEAFDVAAAADFRLIPEMLENGSFAEWEIVFATNPEVLCYEPSLANAGGPLAGINSTNWGSLIQKPGVTMGVANASSDPNGYNEIFVLELQGLVYNGSESAVYSHFFQGSPGGYAKTTSNALVEPETDFATLLSAGTVGVVITYRSYGITHGLSCVPLDPLVGLGNYTSADMTSYTRASTEILGSSGVADVMVAGAPVAFAVTVPTNAPNQSLGLLFVHALVSPEGAAILDSLGFTALLPGYWQASASASEPTYLAPETVALPTSLAADL